MISVRFYKLWTWVVKGRGRYCGYESDFNKVRILPFERIDCKKITCSLEEYYFFKRDRINTSGAIELEIPHS